MGRRGSPFATRFPAYWLTLAGRGTSEWPAPARSSMWAGWLHLAHERKAFRVIERFNGQIDVKIGPVEMMRLWKLDTEKLSDRHVLEPGEMFKRHEEFLASEQEPETMSRDVGNLNVRNVFARLCGFHLHAPE